MKKGLRLLTLGAVAAAATIAGVIVYRNHQDSYVEIDDEETTDMGLDDDFVAVEEMDDGFDYIVEEVEMTE